MLIKESTLRRIIREEARRSLREAENAPLRTAGGPEDRWDGLVSSTTNFATKFATAAKGKGGAPALSSALKDLQMKGMTSKYAAMANAAPGTITGAPANNGAIGKLVCLLAGIVEMRAYTDYNSAQVVLTGISGGQDIVGPMILDALDGNGNAAASMIDNIKTLGSAMPPGYTKPAQAPMAVDPGAGTFLSSELSGNVPSNVKIGRLSYTLPANTIAQITPSLLPVAKGQKILAKGSKGADVATLQQLLNLIAQQNPSVLTQIESDSDFGNATLAAVTAYQKAAGIVVDGKVGQQTLAQIIGRKSSMTGRDGDKGNYFSGLQAATGTTPAGVAGVNPNRIIATKSTQNEGRIRRRY